MLIFFTAFCPIVKGFLPLSVIPCCFWVVSKEVVLSEHDIGTRQTLEIPSAHLMTHFKANFSQHFASIDFGSISTETFEFASQSIFFHV